jgi:hypothetical protein
MVWPPQVKYVDLLFVLELGEKNRRFEQQEEDYVKSHGVYIRKVFFGDPKWSRRSNWPTNFAKRWSHLLLSNCWGQIILHVGDPNDQPLAESTYVTMWSYMHR